MSYFPFPLNDRRTVVYALRSRADAAVHRASSLLHAQLAMRTDRLWLSLVAIPLAIPAVVLAGRFWLWLLPPLALLAWWWGSVEWAWAWLVGIMEACYGIQWMYVGVYALTAYPRHRALVGVLWAGYAALVAAVGAVNRWRYQRHYGW